MQQLRVLQAVCTQPINSTYLSTVEAGLVQLPAGHLEAQRALGLHLLNVYRQQGREADAARLYAYVWQRRGRDAELANHLQLDAVSRHLIGRLPFVNPPAEADLVVLREVAASGTASARLACSTLRFYEPACRCVLKPETQPAATALATTDVANASLMLGQAYPNPAHTAVRLPYTTTRPAQLVCYDAQGRRVHTQALVTGTSEAVLPVQGWAEGLYLVTLVVDGQVRASQRVVVAHQ